MNWGPGCPGWGESEGPKVPTRPAAGRSALSAATRAAAGPLDREVGRIPARTDLHHAEAYGLAGRGRELAALVDVGRSSAAGGRNRDPVRARHRFRGDDDAFQCGAAAAFADTQFAARAVLACVGWLNEVPCHWVDTQCEHHREEGEGGQTREAGHGWIPFSDDAQHHRPPERTLNINSTLGLTGLNQAYR